MKKEYPLLIVVALLVSLSFSLGRTWAAPDRDLQVVDSTGSRLYRQVTVAGQVFCLGPAAWRASYGAVGLYEEWVASDWIDTGKGAINNRPYTITYSTSGGCNNLDGARLSTGDIFIPTAEYGGFLMIGAANEWYHAHYEAGVRSFPNTWTVRGTLL